MLRAFDLVIGLITLVIFAPLLIARALLIYLSNPDPIFFIQQRIGRNGQNSPVSNSAP